MRTSAKYRDLPRWCPAKFRIMQYLAGPAAATLKGCGYALQQNLDKATTCKTLNFLMNVLDWSSCLVFFLFCPSFSDLRISSLKRVQTWTSQVWHCKDPISKIRSWIQCRNLDSIFPRQVFQHLGSWIWIQKFHPGSKNSFFQNLGS